MLLQPYNMDFDCICLSPDGSQPGSYNVALGRGFWAVPASLLLEVDLAVTILPKTLQSYSVDSELYLHLSYWKSTLTTAGS